MASRRGLFAILCCALAAWPGLSFTAAVEPFSLTPAELLALAATPAPRSEFPVVFLTEAVRYEFDDQHRLTLTSHQIYRVDSADAVGPFGQVGVPWEPYRQKKPELRARVVTPDGREYQFDPATLSDETVATGDLLKFDDLHFLRGPLPAIAPGSVVEVLAVLIDEKPKFVSGDSLEVGVAVRGAVQATTITVVTPKDSSFRYKTWLLPDAAVAETEHDGFREFTLQQGPLALRWQDTFVEAAGDAPLWPRIGFTTGRSWEDIAAAYGSLVEPAIQPEEVRALLPADLPADPRQKLARILKILHERIRYTGVFFGQGDIIPNPPSVTLERRYGDCKDKSVVLASLLRAAGMPAKVALLNSGVGKDVDPELPGIAGFNHMIVHVPGEDLWVDATAEFLAAGEKLYPNSGRWALVIGEAGSPLVQTPAMEPSDNREFQQRRVRLAEIGPGDMHVSFRHAGPGAHDLRQLKGHDQKLVQDKLLEQFRTMFAAETASGLEFADDSDSGGVKLDFDVRGIEAASTEMEEAGFTMALVDGFSNLPPGLLLRAPAATEASASGEDVSAASRPETRTLDWIFEPFVSETEVRVVPPKGFRLRSLPKDARKEFGPLVLTQSLREEPDGAVIATIRVDSVRGRYTADEARAFRKAYFAAGKSLELGIWFDHESSLLARAGKPAEALRRHEELSAAEPRKAMPHARAARQRGQFVLMDSAKAEAKRAVELEPDNPWAHDVFGGVLENDSLGRRFEPGFDRAGAMREYREAVRLRPGDLSMRLDLAAVAEVNDRGLRFGDGWDADTAIENYREVAAQRPDWTSAQEWLIQALWEDGRYDEVVSAARAAKNVNYALGALLAARVMQAGAEAALAEDAGLGNAADERKRIFSATYSLWTGRHYDEARELIAAAGRDTLPPDAAPMLDFIDRLRPADTLPPPPATAAGAAESLFRLVLAGESAEEDIIPWVSRRMGTKGEVKTFVEEFARGARLMAANTGRDVDADPMLVRDMVLSGANYQESRFTDEATRVAFMLGGVRMSSLFLVPEDGSWKVLANDSWSPAVARQALAALDAGDVARARQWMQAVKTAGEAMPENATADLENFLGALPDAAALEDPVALRLAALSMLVELSPDAVDAVSLERAADGLATDAQRAILESLRFSVASAGRDGSRAMAAAESYGKIKPGTADALAMNAYAFQVAGDWQEAERASRDWIAQSPGDVDAKQSLVRALNGQGRFADALEVLAQEVRAGNANASQLNNYAWQALRARAVDADVVKASENAHKQRDQRSFAIAHTLACVYADQGRVADARRVLLKMLDDHRDFDPLAGEIWLVRGLIAESLGETKAAQKAFREVEKPEYQRADSTYGIAVDRLTRLERRQ